MALILLSITLLAITVAVAVHRHRILLPPKNIESFTRAHQTDPGKTGHLFLPLEKPSEWRPWSTQLNEGPMQCSYGYGSLFCASQNGNITSLDASRGTVIWSKKVSDSVSAPPLIVNHLVVIVSDGISLQVLQSGTGRELWSFSPGGRITTPVVDGPNTYFTNSLGFLYSVEISSGQLVWRTPVKADPGPVAVAGGRIFLVTADSSLIAASASTGATIWRVHAGGSRGAKSWCRSPIATESTVTCLSDERTVSSFDSNTGEDRWLFRMSEPSDGMLSVGPYYTYAMGKEGRLYAINSSTGRQLWSVKVTDCGSVSPVLYGKTLFLGSRSGNLVALNSATGAWMFVIPPSSHGASSPMGQEPLIGDDFFLTSSENGAVFSKSLTPEQS
ncbi:outer membrane protein assembly factor BamB family protein [Streptomyces bobili]|uniref:outer membrane protein assembly factor BamB family protein n=1 Tax=Streptomyces bobili TaxID=67280 RepID=UPI003830C525